MGTDEENQYSLVISQQKKIAGKLDKSIDQFTWPHPGFHHSCKSYATV